MPKRSPNLGPDQRSYLLALTPTERRRWQEAADAEGLTLALWIRQTCTRRAAAAKRQRRRREKFEAAMQRALAGRETP